MGLCVAIVLTGAQCLGLRAGLIQRGLEVLAPGLAGLTVYFALVSRLNIAEARLIADLVRQRLGV